MSWKKFLREADAASRRAERAAVRRHRELVRQAREHERARAQYQKHVDKAAKEAAKEAERQAAADEVALFENYLEVLTSLHKDVALTTDWTRLLSAQPPEPPEAPTSRQQSARASLKFFKPSLFQRISGKARKTQQALEATLATAVTEEAAEHERALVDHERRCKDFADTVELARGVLRQDVAAYRRVLQQLVGLEELAALGTRVCIDAVQPDVVAVSCEVRDEEIVPADEVRLTAAGKLTTKRMPESRYWSLYQDHVCSCVLRVAREVLGLLPVTRVIINVRTRMLNTSTGHLDYVTILATRLARSAVDGINFEAVDPSDSLKNFEHRMKFKRTSGFEQVEPIGSDEVWLS